jgi:hypothetical protein
MFRRALDSEMKATRREGESIAEKRTRREKEANTDDEEGLLAVVNRLAGRQNCSKFGLLNLILYRKIIRVKSM